MKFEWPTKKSSQQSKQEEEKKQKQKQSLNKNKSTIQDPLLENQVEKNSEANEEEDIFQLRVFDLSIKKGDLAIIIGKIGSGKSALLLSILNELDISYMESQESLLASNIEENIGLQERLTNYEKKIIVNGRIGYVSQNHWLQNKTIKENILFGKEYDPNWYNECVDSCDLQVDFSTFSKQDEKIVGPGGGNLSGGQRQRIAICRALYQNCDIYLFDDIFSSLDAHVADKVYQSVIIDMLIKKYKKTVLLVTSHFSIFSKRDHLSKIVYLQKGSIVEDQQEIEDFIKTGLNKEKEEEEAKKQIQKLKMNLTLEDKIEQQEDEQSEAQGQQEIQSLGVQQRALSDTEQNQPREQVSDKKDQSNKKQQLIVDEEEENTKRQQEEEREKGNIKFETFQTYIKSLSLILLIIFVLSSVFMQGSTMLTDFWLRDQVSTPSPFFEKINSVFSTFTLTYLFFILLNLGMALSRAFFYNFCALHSAKSMFSKLNRSIIYSKMLFFDKNPPGRIVNRLSEDILKIEDSLPWSCQIFLRYFINAVGQFKFFLYNFILSFTFFIFIPIFFLIQNKDIQLVFQSSYLGQLFFTQFLSSQFTLSRNLLEYLIEISKDQTQLILVDFQLIQEKPAKV
ncbi:hypothetical protein ABPG74_019251 [Tetrahymena malaccensis]